MVFSLIRFKAVFIIFDEIQECANARSSIKPFCEDGRFDIIATGSLLGIKGYNKKQEDPDKKFKGLYAETSINGEKVILLEPQTYMNLSGDAVIKYVNFYKIRNKVFKP